MTTTEAVAEINATEIEEGHETDTTTETDRLTVDRTGAETEIVILGDETIPATAPAAVVRTRLTPKIVVIATMADHKRHHSLKTAALVVVARFDALRHEL